LHQTLIGGWRRGLWVVLSPLFTDIPIILLMVFILRSLPNPLIAALQGVGGIIILRLAYVAWRGSHQAITLDPPAGGQPRTLWNAMLVNWVNPGPYLFWGTVNGPLLVRGLEHSPLHGLAFLIGFYGLFLGLMAVQMLIFQRLRRLDPRWVRGMMRLAALLLLVFGLLLLRQAGQGSV
jgi:threonine/homoserine/homoserine lactone efflux protein